MQIFLECWVRAVVFAHQYFQKQQTAVLNREIYIKTCKVKLQFSACDLEHRTAFFCAVGFPSGKWRLVIPTPLCFIHTPWMKPNSFITCVVWKQSVRIELLQLAVLPSDGKGLVSNAWLIRAKGKLSSVASVASIELHTGWSLKWCWLKSRKVRYLG